MDDAIVAEGLSKKYDNSLAVDGISFKVKNGEICGFIGPNGAGKTTTIKILAGLLNPTSGSASISGFDVVAERLKAQLSLGYMPEICRFPGYLSAEELLNYYGRLFGIPGEERKARIDDLLVLVGLDERRKDRIIKYSKGMVQRLGIAQALINNPKVVIMDEPTRGLDPAIIVEFRDIVRALRKDGVTVLLSSHILSEIQQICTHLMIINKGKLVASGTVNKLANISGSVIDIELKSVSNKVENALANLKFVKELKREGNFIQIFLNTNKDVRGVISKTVYEKGGIPLSISTQKPALEEIYLKLTREVSE
jgi:ABC-2 type transport system ATP-binding protein